MDLTDVLAEGLARIADTRPKRAVLIDAYAGNLSLAFASNSLRRDAAGRALERYTHNYVKPIVRARTSRLNVAALGVVKGNPDLVDQTFETYSQEVAFEELERELYREVLTTGAGYVLSWVQPGADVPETLVYGADQMAVITDPARPRVVVGAVLTWVSGNRVRADVYLPGEVHPFVTAAETRDLPTDPASFVPFGDPAANPWGEVPVMEFTAESLVADLVDPQLAHNKAVIDLLSSLEYVSKPLRYAAGLTTQGGPTHKPQPGEVLKLPAGGTLGQLPAADLDKLAAVSRYFAEVMAETSGTPKRVLGLGSQAVPPSGEMLREEMHDLVSQVHGYQVSFGPRWERHLRLVLRMMHVNAVVKVEWADPLPMSEGERVALVEQKVAAGWSRRQALLESGLAEETVDQMLAEHAAEVDRTRQRQRDAFAEGLLPDGDEV